MENIADFVFEFNGKKLIYAPCDCNPFGASRWMTTRTSKKVIQMCFLPMIA
jgi:hypothetical protein